VIFRVNYAYGKILRNKLVKMYQLFSGFVAGRKEQLLVEKLYVTVQNKELEVSKQKLTS